MALDEERVGGRDCKQVFCWLDRLIAQGWRRSWGWAHLRVMRALQCNNTLLSIPDSSFLCAYLCSCVYCEVAFDWFTCVYFLSCISLCCTIWLFLFSRLSFLLICLYPHLSLSRFIPLSLSHFHLVDCHHRCCHALVPNVTRLRWVTFGSHSLLLLHPVFYLMYKMFYSSLNVS